MQWTSLELVNQAMTSLMLGFGLALLNVVARYFAPMIPDVFTVLRWRGGRWRFAVILLAAYLIALVFQIATSPLFRSLIHSVYAELAWSPYEAFFNVMGVLVMDLLVEAWRGATAGRRQVIVARDRAADALSDMNLPSGMSEEERAARRQAQEAADTQAAAERKQRMDERLKDY